MPQSVIEAIEMMMEQDGNNNEPQFLNWHKQEYNFFEEDNGEVKDEKPAVYPDISAEYLGNMIEETVTDVDDKENKEVEADIAQISRALEENADIAEILDGYQMGDEGRAHRYDDHGKNVHIRELDNNSNN